MFTAAIARKDPRVRNLYFDLALVIDAAMDPVRKATVAQRIRAIGVDRILYGTDGGDPTDPLPKTQVQALHSLPLTPAETAPSKRTSRRTCADVSSMRGCAPMKASHWILLCMLGVAPRPPVPTTRCVKSGGNGSPMAAASA